MGGGRRRSSIGCVSGTTSGGEATHRHNIELENRKLPHFLSIELFSCDLYLKQPFCLVISTFVALRVCRAQHPTQPTCPEYFTGHRASSAEDTTLVIVAMARLVTCSPPWALPFLAMLLLATSTVTVQGSNVVKAESLHWGLLL